MAHDIASARVGRMVTVSTLDERVDARIPPPLPPNPAIQMETLYRPLERANRALGRLNGVVSGLPDINLLLFFFCRKEALLSSQIEGAKTTFSDLLLFEDNGKQPASSNDDGQEVVNYIAAMEHGLDRVRGGFPVSQRLIREMHKILLSGASGASGASKQPGEFRRSQNWIGGTRPGNAFYVPPPPNLVPDLMSDIEKFIHSDRVALPELVVFGLVHAQFEAVHPFLDGNGRLGRLLTTLLLCSSSILDEPILYLSLHFKKHRETYYQLLDRVHETGDWETWLEFFLDSIAEASTQAADSADEILRQFQIDQHRIEELGRAAGSVLRVHQQLQQMPLATASSIAVQQDMSRPTAMRSLRHLEELGIVHEFSGRQRRRLYAYKDYLSILSRDTEPISQ